MFFLSQQEKEIPEILKEDHTALEAFKEFRDEVKESIKLYVYDSGPYPEEKGVLILPFNNLAQWAEQDWKSLFPKFEKKRWLVIYIARGGFQLIDLIENYIDDFHWTYYKPKHDDNEREWEDDSIFEEYSDKVLEDKFADYMEESVSLLLIEDVISTGVNVEATYDHILEVAEEYEVEIGETAIISLLTRQKSVGTIPVYGVLADIQIDINTSWGNDLPDRIDYRDFQELKDYCDDH